MTEVVSDGVRVGVEIEQAADAVDRLRKIGEGAQTNARCEVTPAGGAEVHFDRSNTGVE